MAEVVQVDPGVVLWGHLQQVAAAHHPVAVVVVAVLEVVVAEGGNCLWAEPVRSMPSHP